MQNYAKAAHDGSKSEIGGMLVAVQDKDNDWQLIDPVIVKQKISPGNCVLDQEELALYYSKMGAKHKNKTFRFVWWHSHHTMDAFWSGTDLTAIKEYSDGDYSFALVINLKEEYKLRVSVWKPFEIHEDVELNIISQEKKVPKSIAEEVEEKCTPLHAAVTYGSGWQKGKSNQMSLANTEAINDGGQSVNLDLSGDTEDYIYAYKSIEALNRDCSVGQISYNQWVTGVSYHNNVLQEKYKSIYKIELMTESALVNNLLFATPHEYIVVDPGLDPDFQGEYEDWLDTKQHNASFGVD